MRSQPPRFSLAEIADRFDLELRGDGEHAVTGVGTLERGGPDELGFFANRSYMRQLRDTNAGAVIVSRKDAEHCPVNALLAADPYVAYARVAALFDTRSRSSAGVHPSAVVDPDAKLGKGVHVGANAVVGVGAVIGDGCHIGPGCVLGAQCRLGRDCRLEANVTLSEGVTLGQRVLIHPGAVIGADGFGLAFAEDHWEKVPQLGSVVIGDDCEIGANTAIDRGAIEDTVLGNDVRLDNLVQVGHNVEIGDHTAIAGCTAIAGSVRIGRGCLIGGGVGILGHISIADRVVISAMSAVNRDITEAGSTWASGLPARPLREWQRNQTHLRKLDQIVGRIRELEKRAGKPQDHD
ncbi:MAG: UDP-3-O-(3-hydroxymyristoyl)glucosamine N-acyltransferase [Xanthomonadales bacterium]|nr:UDP-3-O-(3-hydroxymyristoyl)glucosamine N-acyltransferase [Xanthomonadales bacterium]